MVKADTNGTGVFPKVLAMRSVFRKGKISEETNLGVELGGSVQKNRTYID